MPCDCFQVSLLAGGRYINIDEDFFYYTESDTPALNTENEVATDTRNSMVGVQIGAMFEFFVDPCWWIDCEIKGAALSNNASQSTDYDYNGVTQYQGSRSEDVCTFALDLNLTATWQVTPNLAVMGGYQALWVDGLALASANFDPDVVLMAGGDTPTLLTNGKVVYHGPHLGATWAF